MREIVAYQSFNHSIDIGYDHIISEFAKTELSEDTVARRFDRLEERHFLQEFFR